MLFVHAISISFPVPFSFNCILNHFETVTLSEKAKDSSQLKCHVKKQTQVPNYQEG